MHGCLQKILKCGDCHLEVSILVRKYILLFLWYRKFALCVSLHQLRVYTVIHLNIWDVCLPFSAL